MGQGQEEGESAQGKELMDNTVIVALISSSGSVLVAITALILNYRGFASIDARMLALESRVDARFNLMRYKGSEQGDDRTRSRRGAAEG